ncbi:sensor histidine kinase KdpD [Gordonibacter sp.]|uniref:sensor histidine kinase KdpD n=1 Tax=Gordonibacter sp. TaxID=1968902 RepID=UPI002FCC6CCC
MEFTSTPTQEPCRPDPDDLLRAITAEEHAGTSGKRRGRLKVFFGYAAGVGKTYSMLEAAHVAHEHKRDVVVGYIEPHTRPDTLAWLEGLEVLPPREISYKGMVLKEFDVDAALERKPDLILVDELAHTNASGSRHAKRYLDVEELLHAGIDVYTTVNVQHLESLNDKVSSTTEIVVQERIPDRIFDYADSVEIIDLDPDDLIDRLEGGKIYRSERAKTALANFFSKKNLAYLRELALRRTADRLNRNLERGFGRSTADARDDVLVLVSPSLGNVSVIRAAARLAAAYRGTLTALVVEPTDTHKLSDQNQNALHSNVDLAEELGAHIVTVPGDDAAVQIAQYALSGTISKIVVGSSEYARPLLPFLPAWRTIADRLVSLSCTTDVVVIADRHKKRAVSGPKLAERFKPTGTDFIAASLALFAATVLGLLFHEGGLAGSTILAIYLVAVLLGALKADSFFYSLIVSPSAVLLFNFFFTTPRFTLSAYGLNYPFLFVFLFATSMIVSSLTIRTRREAEKNARKAYRTEVLLETEHRLQEASGVANILSTTAEQIIKLLRTTVVIYQVTPHGTLSDPSLFSSNNPDENVSMTDLVREDEAAVAAWVAGNNKRAGTGTDTLMNARCLYLPIRGKETAVGVAGIVLSGTDGLDAFEKSLLLVMLDECGQAVERERASENAHRSRLKAEQESLRANLLRSISHDLRTPLTSISGDASILLSSADVLSDEKKRAIYTDIHEDALWLVNLVENLLVVTRLDNGTLSLKTEPELVEDVVREALRHLNRKAAEHLISVRVDDPLLMMQADGRLIMQVIINLVNNAVTYTPAGSHIEVSAHHRGSNFVSIAVSDDGPGIAPAERPDIFTMFYQGKNVGGDARRGLGLGLALCKSIVEIHGGTIAVDALPPRKRANPERPGTVITFTLPAVEYEMNTTPDETDDSSWAMAPTTGLTATTPSGQAPGKGEGA